MAFRKLYLLAWLAAISMLGACHRGIHKRPSQEPIYETIVNHKGGVVHAVTVDLSHNKLVLFQPKNPPLQTVSKVAHEQAALVAINAGFFAKEGYPVGMLKIDGKIISKPAKNRGVMGWNNGFFFDRLAPGSAQGLVSELHHKPWWDDAQNIVGGAPLLLFRGEILSFSSEGTLDAFIQNSYARTAVCVDTHKKLKFFVVDGGDSKTMELGGGMSIPELAQFLLEQGCTDALNLDGGYSSSLVFRGEKKNRFSVSSLEERPVSTMLLVMPR